MPGPPLPVARVIPPKVEPVPPVPPPDAKVEKPAGEPVEAVAKPAPPNKTEKLPEPAANLAKRPKPPGWFAQKMGIFGEGKSKTGE